MLAANSESINDQQVRLLLGLNRLSLV